MLTEFQLNVDWSRIESLVDINDPEDQAWLKDMIASLLENMSVRMQNLSQLVESKQAKELQAELHQIKGVAANFGLAAMSKLVVEAEAKVKEGDMEGSVSLSIQVPPVWEETKKELQAKFGS